MQRCDRKHGMDQGSKALTVRPAEVNSNRFKTNRRGHRGLIHSRLRLLMYSRTDSGRGGSDHRPLWFPRNLTNSSALLLPLFMNPNSLLRTNLALVLFEKFRQPRA